MRVNYEEADEVKIDLNAMGYDELIAHGEDVMRAIRMRAYGEGYRQGKFDAEMDTTYGQAPVVSAQARRDEIVEQAKADAEELVMDNTSEWCGIDFIVNRNKRTVVALIKGEYTSEVFARGIAKAAPDDCFNVHIGKAVALRRALGLAVPDEYLNAPQPTEVRVGDVVYYSRKYPRLTVSEEVDHRTDFVPIQSVRLFLGNGITTIIDDSREEVIGE
ncbi:hypothetical protein [Bacillus velezensis]|uniref:hypothetical protein n=1 Tax=Bacillus velezensis TaxID=492670 RepID=UPI0011AB68E3|nr:hypothetical protein [Bacillus velezensis]